MTCLPLVHMNKLTLNNDLEIPAVGLGVSPRACSHPRNWL